MRGRVVKEENLSNSWTGREDGLKKLYTRKPRKTSMITVLHNLLGVKFMMYLTSAIVQ